MTKFSAYLKISFAVLLYILSAFTFIDIMYSLVIPDTVTAVENAFGKLVILIFMLVLENLPWKQANKSCVKSLPGMIRVAMREYHPITAISMKITQHLPNLIQIKES